MTWGLQWTQASLKDLEHLDAQNKQRVRETLQKYAGSGQGNVKRIGQRTRLRIGDYRAFFTWDLKKQVIYVQRVRHRSKAYQTP